MSPKLCWSKSGRVAHLSELLKKPSIHIYTPKNVTPAKAGAYLTLCKTRWVPAYAGMTEKNISLNHTFQQALQVGSCVAC